MSNDVNDPFAAFNSDRTVIKPRAGRTPRAGAAQAPGSATPEVGVAPVASGKETPLAMDALMTASLNPLVAAAAPLLAAAPRVRSSARHSNPAGLREALAEGIRNVSQPKPPRNPITGAQPPAPLES